MLLVYGQGLRAVGVWSRLTFCWYMVKDHVLLLYVGLCLRLTCCYKKIMVKIYVLLLSVAM